MAKRFLIDTNVLLDNPNIINTLDGEVIIHSIVCEEIDNIIHSDRSEDTKYRARQARNFIKSSNVVFNTRTPSFSLPMGWDYKNDNSILALCKDLDAMLCTNDLAMQIKADSIGVEWIEDKIFEHEETCGWKEVLMTKEEQADFYTNMENKYGLMENEYLIMVDKDTGECIDKYKLTLDGFTKVKYHNIDSKDIGKVKPRNIHQELAFDMLQDDKTTIKVITSSFGCGKDYIMLSHALNLIEKNKSRFKKIIWCRNTVETKNSKAIGFLKGDMNDKLLPFAMPMADHMGGEEGLRNAIDRGLIELQHLGFIRGRDIKDSILYCSEGENLTKEHVQLLIGRIGEGSVLYLNGDFKQVDDKVFEKNNGLNISIKKLRGHKNFAHVKLIKTERSETAAMADLLD